MELNDVTGEIVDASLAVHSELGPGLMESAYETCLAHELRSRGLVVESQVPVPIRYKGLQLDAGYRLDLLVEKAVIVELKACENLLPIHQAQVLSYLRLTDKRVGLLINFNVVHLKHGVKRIANNV